MGRGPYIGQHHEIPLPSTQTYGVAIGQQIWVIFCLQPHQYHPSRTRRA